MTAAEFPEEADTAGEGKQGQELQHQKPGHVKIHFGNRTPQEEVLQQQS